MQRPIAAQSSDLDVAVGAHLVLDASDLAGGEGVEAVVVRVATGHS
jgi:hypothetical protein